MGVFGRDNPLWTLSILGPPPWCSVGLDGTGSRTGQVLGRDRFSGLGLGGCSQQVVLGGRLRGLLGLGPLGRLAGGDPVAGYFPLRTAHRSVLGLVPGGRRDGAAVFSGPESVLSGSGAVLECQASCQAIQEKPRHVVSGVGSLNPGPALRSSSLFSVVP